MYTSLAKLLGPVGKTHGRSRNEDENYSSISAINQHQLCQKMYE